jgi:Skp family chaperone for outer membrane proteins
VDNDEIRKKIRNAERQLVGKKRIIQALKDEIAGYEEELVKTQNEFNILESELQKMNLILLQRNHTSKEKNDKKGFFKGSNDLL